jgi:hypothetical protein
MFTPFPKFIIKKMRLCNPWAPRNTFLLTGKPVKLDVFFVPYVAFTTLFHLHRLYSVEYDGKMIMTNECVLNYKGEYRGLFPEFTCRD